jgi:hypothetical protein
MDLRCSPWPAMDRNRGDSAMNRSHGRSLTQENMPHNCFFMRRKCKLDYFVEELLAEGVRLDSSYNVLFEE